LKASPSDELSVAERTIDRDAAGPGWLDNRRLLLIAAASLAGLVGLATFSVLYFAKSLFFPITLALVLKLVFAPVVRHLNQWSVPSPVAGGLVVAGILGLVVAGAFVLSEPAGQWIDAAPAHFKEVKYKLRAIQEPIRVINDTSDQVTDLTELEGEKKPLEVAVKESGAAASLLNNMRDAVAAPLSTLVILYFLLAGGDRLLEKVLSLTSGSERSERIVILVRDIQDGMSSYLLTTTGINIALGIFIGVGLWLIGLPNPVLWGAMATCLNYIPYVGAIIGGLLVFFVGLISFDSLGQAAWAPAIYFGVNAIEGYLITPTVLARSISLSPVAIILSLLVWGWIWGIGGLLLAVPILMATKIACDHIEPLQPLGCLLGR